MARPGGLRFQRRAFLRLLAAVLTRSALPAFVPPGLVPPAYALSVGPAPAPIRPAEGFARSISWGVPVRDEPDLEAAVNSYLYTDDLLPLYRRLDTNSGSAHNKAWFEVQGGYVHSAFIQPTQWRENPSPEPVGSPAFWGEVTVPFVDALIAPSYDARRNKYRYYYGTTYRVIQVVDGESGPWNKIEDEEFPAPYYVPARYMRTIAAEEFSVLSPDVDPEQKRLKVDINGQRVLAYEGAREVFSTRAATGHRFDDTRDFRTRLGAFRVFRKTPTQHMHGGTPGTDDYFDLPGIPWVSYFTDTGVAFHGAYWHNDYGVTRSHGCINVTPEAAKWIWRWCLPNPDPKLRYTPSTQAQPGTRVDVVGTY